jgi:hypothetical protein
MNAKLMICLLAMSMQSNLVAAKNCMDITIPAFNYPTVITSPWFNNAGISDAPLQKGRYRTFIMNPASGPGICPSTDCTTFTNAVASVRAADTHVLVYGYVTAFDNINQVFRTLDAIEADVVKYSQYYTVDGIYLDQVSTDPLQVAPFYQPLVTYISNLLPGGDIILGTGMLAPTDALMQMTVNRGTNLSITYESFYASFVNYAPPPWVYNYPDYRFWYIIHDTPADQMANALTLASSFNAGQIYVTDGLQASGNPYATLPSYWSSLVPQTQNGCN